MLKKIFLIILFAFGFIPLNAQTLSEAEKLYQDGDFAKAIPLYEQIIQTADGDTLLQAQLRKAASQYALGEYMNATKTMFGYALPSDNIWQARFRLYRIQMAKQVSSLYNRLLEKREIDSPDAKADLETWTRAQWQEQIEKEYEALWALRTDLINAPTESENLILNLKDTDTRRLATLFDFATNGWIQWINANEVSLSASAPRTYLNGQAQIHPTARNKAGKLAEILENRCYFTAAGTRELVYDFR